MMSLQLIRTVRHLRPTQIVGQVRNRLLRFIENPNRFFQQTTPPFPGCHWVPRTDFLPPGAQVNEQKDLLVGQFTFLNDTRAVGWPLNWDISGVPKLWIYNLFYFEYLWVLEYERGKELVQDWIARHPLSRDATGWQPYPTSLRLMNWCGYFCHRYRSQTEADPAFAEMLWRSIYLQTQWLSNHLETHLLGNHLFENVAALAIVGNCFDGPSARQWLHVGRTLLERELHEQILPDGGHFERSPMYQSRVVYVLTQLQNVADPSLVTLIEPYLVRSSQFLQLLCHPDQQIALFNDSAFGIYNPPCDIAAYVGKLGIRSSDINSCPDGTFALHPSGYYGVHDKPSGNYLVIDAGLIGPDYLPGHAHGDIFSFELSLRGQRVIVDSGVFDYESGPRREYCRSTRAHNTVEIDGQDQCEFWAAFRVARRGRPHEVKWVTTTDGFQLSGWHDGYLRLSSRAKHARQFRWHASGVLMVRDTTTARSSVTVVSRIHLHPDCRISRIDQPSRCVEVSYLAGEFRIVFAGQGEIGTEAYPYCPEFGRESQGQVITLKSAGLETRTGFCVSEGPSAVQFDWEKGAFAHGCEIGW